MWPWVVAAAFCCLLMVVMVLLYRRAVLIARATPAEGGVPPIEEVAALLQELSDAGEAIIARLESKKAEIDAMLRVLDAKLESVQLVLQAQQAAVPPTAAVPAPAAARPSDLHDGGGRHDQVRALQQAGWDPLAIAQKTGLRLDEVRLIISLQQSHQKNLT